MSIREAALPAPFRGGPPGVSIAGWLLRVAVLGHALGVAYAILTKLGSGLGTYFFLEWGFTHPQVAPFERGAAYVLVALAVLAFLRPHWVFLAPIAAIIFLDASAHYFNSGFPFAEWVIGAHAARYTAPLALLALFFVPLGRWLGPANHLRAAGYILRAGLATVFFVHGLEAFLQHPRFLDYILMTTHNFTGYYMAEATAGMLLQIIGVVDIIVAALILVKPHPAVLYWAAFWGLITAFSRVTSLGVEHHYEVLLRFAHFLGPIALVCMLKAQRAYAAGAARPATPPAGAISPPA